MLFTILSNNLVISQFSLFLVKVYIVQIFQESFLKFKLNQENIHEIEYKYNDFYYITKITFKVNQLLSLKQMNH